MTAVLKESRLVVIKVCKTACKMDASMVGWMAYIVAAEMVSMVVVGTVAMLVVATGYKMGAMVVLTRADSMAVTRVS